MFVATQDSTMKDSTQNFNIKSLDQKFAHSEQIGPKTHTVMENQTEATAQQAQPAATLLAEGTVKKFTVQVMRVQLFDDADIVNVQLLLNKAIPGFVQDDNGNYVAADVYRVNLSRSALTRTLCEKNEMVATMRDGQATPFTRAQLSTMLHGARIALVRTYHLAGYTAEGRAPLVRDQWFTTIDDIKLTDFAEKLIQQLVMQRMMNE